MSNLRIVAAQIIQTSEAWLCPMPTWAGLGKYSIGAHLRQTPVNEARSHRNEGELVCAGGLGNDSEQNDGKGFLT